MYNAAPEFLIRCNISVAAVQYCVHTRAFQTESHEYRITQVGFDHSLIVKAARVMFEICPLALIPANGVFGLLNIIFADDAHGDLVSKHPQSFYTVEVCAIVDCT